MNNLNPHYHIKDFIFFVRQRSSDIPIIKEVVTNDIYNSGLIQPHDVVIDVGAHIGTFTVLASSMGASVVSYEPVQRNFNLLKDNVEINGYPAKLNKLAVAGENTLTKIYIRDFNFGGSNLYEKNNDPEFQEAVECISLDEAFKRNSITFCHFLKLDCEGAECEILKNFSDLKKIKHIVMEYRGGETGNKLEKLLKDTHKVEVQYQTINQLGLITADLK